ncbi:MAG: RNA polymerase sigma factor, partial [Planctomycetota bacterium]
MAESDDLGQIIAECKDGEPESFSKLIDIYSGRLYGYFYRLTGSRETSDDLLSELFVKLVEKIGRYRGGSFNGWLFKIASNIFHDYLRDKQRQKRLLDGRKERLESEYRRRQEDDRADRLQTALWKLDEDTRELIMLRFFSQASFKELAAMRSEP